MREKNMTMMHPALEMAFDFSHSFPSPSQEAAYLELAEARVDDKHDAVHGQRGLGNVCGHHALADAIVCSLEDLGLLVGGQLQKKRGSDDTQRKKERKREE
jgi:hypothetical protein